MVPHFPKAEIVCGEIGLSLAGRTRKLLKEELIKPSTLFVAWKMNIEST